MALFIVTVGDVHYGPLDADMAAEFAEFATAEIDPAQVSILRSPTRELLAWRKAVALAKDGA